MTLRWVVREEDSKEHLDELRHAVDSFVELARTLVAQRGIGVLSSGGPPFRSDYDWVKGQDLPMAHTPRDPDFERRVRLSFGRQAAMATLGATIMQVTPGEVVLELPFRSELTQQHGFLHAGIVTAVMDSACGYAALSLMDVGVAGLTVEFKVNLLRPARGQRFRAIGWVVRPGRTLTVVSGEFRSVEATAEAQPAATPQTLGELIATMTGTMIALPDRPGLVD